MSEATSFQDHAVHEAAAYVRDSAAYFSAVALCPRVVEKESPHDLFLCFCEYNVWDAAQRLTTYWRLRLQVFGADLAFLPLNTAMRDEDWQLLESGGSVILPFQKDEGRRSVMFLDRQRLATMPTGVLPSRLRAVFYLLHNLHLQASEFVWMMKVGSSGSGRSLSMEIFKVIQLGNELTSHALCLKSPVSSHLFAVTAGQLVCCRGGSSTFGLFSRTAWTSYICRLSAWFQNKQTHMHAGTREETLRSLQDIIPGMKAEHIPSSVGGSWTYERDWMDWLHERRYGSSSAARAVSPSGQPETVRSICFQSEGTPSPTILAADQKTQAPTSSLSPLSFAGHPVHQAIMAQVKPYDAAAYLRAAVLCPSVIESESNHELFLAFCDFDEGQAAQRLARYWSVRADIFGDVSAFVPLRNALQRQDVELLETSRCCAVLPQLQQAGLPACVLFLTMSGAVQPAAPQHELASLLRCVFFLFQHMMEQSQSFVILLQVNATNDISEFLYSTNAAFQQHILRLMNLCRVLTETAMCLKPYQHTHVHLACVGGEPRDLMNQVTTQLILQIPQEDTDMCLWLLNLLISPHGGNSRAQVAASLVHAAGFSLAGLPTSLGGSWSFDTEHVAWLRQYVWGDAVDEVQEDPGGCCCSSSEPVLYDERQYATAEEPLHVIDADHDLATALLGGASSRHYTLRSSSFFGAEHETDGGGLFQQYDDDRTPTDRRAAGGGFSDCDPLPLTGILTRAFTTSDEEPGTLSADEPGDDALPADATTTNVPPNKSAAAPSRKRRDKKTKDSDIAKKVDDILEARRARRRNLQNARRRKMRLEWRHKQRVTGKTTK